MTLNLRRPLATYQGCSPKAVASGSTAQMMYFVEDAKADIATLAQATVEISAAAADYAKLIQVENFDRNDIAVHGAYERLRVAIDAVAKASL